MESIPPTHGSSAAASSAVDNIADVEQEDEEMHSLSSCSAFAVPRPRRPPIERVSKKKTCRAWEFVYNLSNNAFVNSRPLAVQKKGIPSQFVCRLVCYEDTTNLPIIDCVVALHKNGISNGISHLLF
jgi:hypothetical protein